MIKNRNIIKTINNPRDGKGKMEGLYITDGDIFNGVNLLALFILDPKSSIGYHIHQGEGELYYIIEGEGLFIEDNKEYKVSKGDFCLIESGQGHALVNESDTKRLKFIAVVFKDYIDN